MAEIPADRQFTVAFTQETSTILELPDEMYATHFSGIGRDHCCFFKCSRNPLRVKVLTLRGKYLITGWKKFTEIQQFQFGDNLRVEYKGDWNFEVEVEEHIQPQAAVQEDERNQREQRFVTLNVTADKIERSRMYLPQWFTEANGLKMLDGQDIFMASEEAETSSVTLKMEFKGGRERMQLTAGLRSYLEDNNMMPGDKMMLELLWENDTPTLHLRSKNQ